VIVEEEDDFFANNIGDAEESDGIDMGVGDVCEAEESVEEEEQPQKFEDEEDPIDPSLPEEEQIWQRQLRQIKRITKPPEMNEILECYLDCLDFFPLPVNENYPRPEKCPSPPPIETKTIERKKTIAKPQSKQ
jgi:hypothetical protein